MVPLDKLREITQRFEYIEAQMSAGTGDIAQLGREYAELRPVVEEIRAYNEVLDGIGNARAMLDDPEMKDLAAEELDAMGLSTTVADARFAKPLDRDLILRLADLDPPDRRRPTDAFIAAFT